MGKGRGIGRSGRFFPPLPVLVARAQNNNDKDGCIIVKEIREKMHLLHLLLKGPTPSTRQGHVRSKGADAPGVDPGLWEVGQCVVAFQKWQQG